ncbi:hypothetical protein DBR11_11540 [Pedobacter sp. HMWF019]|uniref:TolC family protein n=1 Tax=Pedobacter sp. HMWF019 TaxID=2056856 RepID=UPI000D3CC5C1|nr:TolC family protein [Pedobacter sp. HMWF019]PTS99817.1 hypothetical protein DBR11_11540 [Pedobacter sp. HMWF019]
MMRNPLQLLCLLFILFSIRSRAQQPINFSLKQAFKLADQTYPGLAEREARIGEYELRKQEAKSRSLPQIQLQVQNSYGTFEGTNGAFFPVPGVFNVSGSSKHENNSIQATGNTFGSVLMDWKFYEFGKQRKTIQAADYQLQGAKSSYEASSLSLHAKVSRLYIDVQYSYANLNWASKNVDRFKQILDLSTSLTEAGLKPGADTSISSSAYAQALALKDNWKGKYLASQINLTEVVPFKQISLPQPTLQVSFKNNLLKDSVVLSHPYLQVLDKQVLYEKAQQAVVSSKILPSLSILGGLATRGSGINSNGNIENGIGSGYQNYANNYLIGVGLIWNIGNAYTSSLERKRAQKTIQGAQSRYDLQKLQMNIALGAVSAQIDQQVQLLHHSEMALKKATEAYESYLTRYESGLINLTDLLQIQSLLQLAEKEQLQAAQTFWNLLITQAELSGDFTNVINQFN